MNEIPAFLLEKLKEQYDEESINRIIEGYQVKRKTTLRVNALKTSIEEVEKSLQGNNIAYQRVSWYEDALILEEATEKDIRKLPIYEEGKIYLQSLSSMIPALIMNPQSNENILDMCAAPGGKTVQMAALSYNTSLITACEKNKIRVERLQYNIQKQGATKITILKEDARNLSSFFSFDKILLDSPCSGSGTLNLDDIQLKKSISEDLVNRSIKVQQVLLEKAIQLLKSGHEIVYSTCSILKEENEEQIKKLVEKGKIKVVPIQEEFNFKIPVLPSTIQGAITICPTEYYEGFFVVKLQKII